jgi:hypothetical protein
MMKEKVDLRCLPFRGILKEMGEELDMPTDQLHKALFKRKAPNPEYAAIFDRKLKERLAVIDSFKKTIRKAV